MLEAKDMGLTKGNPLTWTKDELLQISNITCDILPIKSTFLTNYTSAIHSCCVPLTSLYLKKEKASFFKLRRTTNDVPGIAEH